MEGLDGGPLVQGLIQSPPQRSPRLHYQTRKGPTARTSAFPLPLHLGIRPPAKAVQNGYEAGTFGSTSVADSPH